MAEKPAIQMTPVTSSMMSSYHHDPATRVLTVEFKGGARYQYADVGVDKVATMAEAKSPGGFFSSRIKGLHPATKL